MILQRIPPLAPRLPKLLSLRFALAAAACLVVCLGTRAARADDAPDTVMLTNGGRMRGTVMEEDPQKGTSVKLLDGTVKRLAPGDVKRVVYAGDSQPAPPVAPPAPPAPAVAPTLAVPMMMAAGSVPVMFEPSGSSEYQLSVTQPGRAMQQCLAPCTLGLQPGSALVAVKGDVSFNQTIVVSPMTSRFVISRRRGGQLIAAEVIGGAGAITLIVMVATLPSASVGETVGLAVGVGVLGATSLILGLTAGSNNVEPVDTSSALNSAPRLRGVGVCPLPGGGGFVGASFTF